MTCWYAVAPWVPRSGPSRRPPSGERCCWQSGQARRCTSCYENRGLLWNNYPTIKFQEDQDLLWQAIADNRLQVVSSDHFLMAEDRYGKMGVTVDALQAGQAGVELRIPVLFHLGVQGGRITVNRF